MSHGPTPPPRGDSTGRPEGRDARGGATPTRALAAAALVFALAETLQSDRALARPYVPADAPVAELEAGCDPGGGSLATCLDLAIRYTTARPADPSRERAVLTVGCSGTVALYDVCARLAVMADRGEGGPVDPRLAADAGANGCTRDGRDNRGRDVRAEACRILGAASASGEGYLQDLRVSRAAYATACALGLASACAEVPLATYSLSPDGRWLVTWDDLRPPRIWSVDDGVLRYEHPGRVDGAAWAPDSSAVRLVGSLAVTEAPPQRPSILVDTTTWKATLATPQLPLVYGWLAAPDAEPAAAPWVWIDPAGTAWRATTPDGAMLKRRRKPELQRGDLCSRPSARTAEGPRPRGLPSSEDEGVCEHLGRDEPSRGADRRRETVLRAAPTGWPACDAERCVVAVPRGSTVVDGHLSPRRAPAFTSWVPQSRLARVDPDTAYDLVARRAVALPTSLHDELAHRFLLVGPTGAWTFAGDRVVALDPDTLVPSPVGVEVPGLDRCGPVQSNPAACAWDARRGRLLVQHGVELRVVDLATGDTLRTIEVY